MMRRSNTTNNNHLLVNSKAGLEIETCVYFTDYFKEDFEMNWMEILDKFYEHLNECLNPQGVRVTAGHESDGTYQNWMLVGDRSIRCPNNQEDKEELEKEGYLFDKNYIVAANEDDMLSYTAVEIVTSVYYYDNIPNMLQHISCLITDDFAYGFNSSQGIHYNISNSILNQMEEDERYFAIERILELMWYLEPMFVSFLPKYRQKEVYNGKYCNSLERVFGNLSNMKANWRRFYIRNEDEHEEIDNGMGKLFVPKYTIINLKNITDSSTEGVYFEFRLGSIHMIPELMNAWIKMLMVLIVSGIDENVYSQLVPTSDKRKRSRDLETSFREILEQFGGPDMVEETLGVIEGLPIKGGPGSG